VRLPCANLIYYRCSAFILHRIHPRGGVFFPHLTSSGR